jgi:hypothetical protein
LGGGTAVPGDMGADSGNWLQPTSRIKDSTADQVRVFTL